MKLRHFAVFGGIFTVIICLLLFLFIVTADDEENSTSYFDFSGLNLSEEVLKHQPTVELADPKKGDRVIDVCAAPGGKALQVV